MATPCFFAYLAPILSGQHAAGTAVHTKLAVLLPPPPVTICILVLPIGSPYMVPWWHHIDSVQASFKETCYNTNIT
ncbi:unnamed protein product [Urochloa humidicola]